MAHSRRKVVLVLRRALNEEIVISDRGGNVLGRMIIADLEGNQVGLGFFEADDLVIDRFEVWEDKQAGIPPRNPKKQ